MASNYDAVHYPDYPVGQEIGIMSKIELPQPQPEYISTKEAAKILKVGSTQAVRYLMEQYPDKLPGHNFGSKKQPRWMLRRIDVINFQLDRSDEL
jgi:hypothetical protein